jgi:hypothetical protein
MKRETWGDWPIAQRVNDRTSSTRRGPYQNNGKGCYVLEVFALQMQDKEFKRNPYGSGNHKAIKSIISRMIVNLWCEY